MLRNNGICFYLVNDHGDFLKLKHHSGFIFNYSYCRADEVSKYKFAGSYLVGQSLVEAFFKLDDAYLKRKMTLHPLGASELRLSFKSKEFERRPRFITPFMAFFDLVLLGVAVLFLLLSRTLPSVIVVFSFLLALASAIGIHLNYYMASRGLLICMSIGNPDIRIKFRGKAKLFVKKNIIKSVHYHSKSDSFPLSEYYYTIWHLDDGSRVVLTSLLISREVLKHNIAEQSSDEEFFEYLPLVRHMTWLT